MQELPPYHLPKGNEEAGRRGTQRSPLDLCNALLLSSEGDGEASAAHRAPVSTRRAHRTRLPPDTKQRRNHPEMR